MAERFAPVNPLAAANRQYYRDPMAKDDKAERLAAALRENLKRRKAQAREAQKKDPTQPAKE
ncbi:MAG: hypothetical protein M3Q19_08980 [Pseudomonadota bacterium]|nr:hypothetical protein [Pseudomonadota bacterium]